MSDAQQRLTHALGVASPPARDPNFVLAVLRAGEAARWRDGLALAGLRAAGLAALAASLVPTIGELLATPEAASAGLLALAALGAGWALTRLVNRSMAKA